MTVCNNLYNTVSRLQNTKSLSSRLMFFEFKFLRDSRTHSGGRQIQSWSSSDVWWHRHIYICQIKEIAVDRSLQVTGNSTMTSPRRCSMEICLYIKRSTEMGELSCNL